MRQTKWWLVVLIIGFLGDAYVASFGAARASITGRMQSYPTAGLIFLAIALVRGQKRIKEQRSRYNAACVACLRAPEAEQPARMAIMISVLGLVASVAYGVVAGREAGRRDELRAQIATAMSEGRWAQESLDRLLSAEPDSWDAYIRQAHDIEPLLKAGIVRVRHNLQLLAEAKRSFPNDTSVYWSERISHVDIEAMEAWLTELAAIKTLASVPEALREQHFETYIQPLRQARIQKGTEEARLVNEAKAVGAISPPR